MIAPPLGTPPVISVRGLARVFGSRVAVDRLDLEVMRGEVFGLLGPNGAGKSTLMRILVGAMLPSAGTVEVLGLELPRQAESLRERIGYMPQAFSLYGDLTAEDNLAFAAEIFSLGGRDRGERRQRIETALAAYGLEDRRAERAAALSGGWKQRLALAVATIHEPRLLVLDEPTAGIDPEQRRLLWDRLAELATGGVTVLVSTHSMDEARRCHRLCMMRRGRVVALGSPPDLCAELVGRVFEVRGAPAADTVRALRGQPAVAALTQLGEVVHVLASTRDLGQEWAKPLLGVHLAAAGLEEAAAAPVPPTLEDVFVAASMGEKIGELEPVSPSHFGSQSLSTGTISTSKERRDRRPSEPRPMPAPAEGPGEGPCGVSATAAHQHGHAGRAARIQRLRGLALDDVRGSFRRALRRIRAIARNEIHQLRHDRLALGFVAGVPLLQLVLFGYAINQDVRGIATAVLDRSQSSFSRRLVGQLGATQTFRVQTAVTTEDEGWRRLARGDVQAVLVVPPDFATHLLRRHGATISIFVDASDPLVARAARLAADGLARQLTVRAAASGASPDLVAAEPFVFSVRPYYNPELRTPVFVVPGLVGVILTTTMILLTAVALVRERERGTFEFLIGTPVRRSELMLGKILPYVALGLLQAAFILIAGRLLFRVPVEGSLVSLAVGSLLFIAANLSLGLLISAGVRTQLQATQIAFFFFLPSVLLSGFMFPFNSMPALARWLGELLPLTHYIRLCRAVLLRGSPAWDLPADLLALAIFSIVGLLLASRVFRKELE
jgi:ABC-2 type transport system permease protein